MTLRKYYKAIAKELSDYIYGLEADELKKILSETYYGKKQISDRLLFFIHKGELQLEALSPSPMPNLLRIPLRPKGFKELRYVKKGWSETCISSEVLEHKGLIQLALEEAVNQLLRRKRIKIAEFSLYVVDSEPDDDDYINFAVCCRVFKKGRVRTWWSR